MNTQQLKELFAEWQRAKADSHYPTISFEESDMLEVAFSALSDRLEAAERERDELRAERDGAIESALAVADAWLRRAKYAEAEIARRDAADRELLSGELSRMREWVKCVEAERDKSISWHSPLLKKFDNLQAEIARRDATAGERAGIVEVWPGTRSCDFLLSRPLPVGQHNVYTTAQPAVLPTEVMKQLSDAANTVSEWTHGDEHSCKVNRTALIAAVEALGAQQQKVVELPEPVKWPEVPYRYFSEDQVFSMLNAANVKWEVKK